MTEEEKRKLPEQERDKTGESVVQNWRKSEGGERWEEKQKREEKLFEVDRIKNPHLALISEHLWWLALMVKISLIFMLISIIGMLIIL